VNITINPRFKKLIPQLSVEEKDRLEQNIISDGCRDPLVVWGNVLVDGHNRYEICTRRGVSFKTQPISFPSEEHAELWIRFNQLGRRNLTDDQRAVMADAASELDGKLSAKERASKAGKSGGRNHPKVSLADGASAKLTPSEIVNGLKNRARELESRPKAAKAAKVSERKMKKARRVRRARPDLAQKVEDGELTLAAAEREVNESERREKLKTMDWPAAKYRVIYADPPWQYGDARTGTKESGGVVAQYDTMPIEAICAMDVRGISTPDAVLFLWATSPLIPEAIRVIDAWGFKYKASFVWDKERGFNGHYNDVQHEFLLIATRGSCVPETKTLPKSVVRCTRDKHSKKPQAFRDIINDLYPTGPRVELFAREIAAGWAVWGNEVKNA
jgi:N6-adenosine-specific RNA methylase IME4